MHIFKIAYLIFERTFMTKITFTPLRYNIKDNNFKRLSAFFFRDVSTFEKSRFFVSFGVSVTYFPTSQIFPVVFENSDFKKSD